MEDLRVTLDNAQLARENINKGQKVSDFDLIFFILLFINFKYTYLLNINKKKKKYKYVYLQ